MDCSSSSFVVTDSTDFSNDFEKKKSFRQKIFPSSFKKEFQCVLRIYIPCVLTHLFRFLNPAISLIMCGKLSKLEFDASSLANSFIYIFGATIDMGFSTAFDILFAQLYGCGQKKKMGVLLQKAVIIMTLVYIILACFHLNIEPILILLKQNPLVSELTTRYITIYLPGLFFDFQFLAISRYLQNQNILYPTMISAFASNIINFLGQYIAIYVYGYGLDSSALMQAISSFVMCALQLAYILISKVYKDTWDGFSLRGALENWKIIFSLGIPGILMLLLEEGTFEFGTILAGSMDLIQLGAQTIALECATLSLISTFGLEVAVTMLIGQYLGSRNIKRLKTCFRTAIIMAISLSTITFSLVYFLRFKISTLFTNDLEIQNEGADLLVYISALQIFDVLAGVTSGVVKACGRQILGTFVMFVCYYIIGLPLGIVLAFVYNLKIKGVWIGLIVALFIETTLFSIVIYRTDWEAECDKASTNAEYFDDKRIDNTYKDDLSEETPLLIKSDIEGDTDFVRECLLQRTSKIRKENNRWSTQSLCEDTNDIEQRRRTMMVFELKPFNGPITQSFRKIVISRIIAMAGVILVFLGFLLVRIYVPKTWYMPCVPSNNDTTIRQYEPWSTMLCHYNVENITVPR